MSTRLMGILNVTPDSCFDQGRWFDPQVAIQRGIEITQQGADLLDIGGESTRPGARPVTESEELKRVIPVIRALKEHITIPISIDTRNPKVAEAALEAGAALINDITGFQHPEMKRLAAQSGKEICVMHMQGDPQTMQINPFYEEGIINHLLKWFDLQIESLLEAGVKEHQIILDPGIGFGKTVAHNLEILHNLQNIKALGFPLLLGLSRKSFLGKILNKSYPDLLPATLTVSTLAVLAGVDILRVHDITEHKDLITVMKQIHLQLNNQE